MGDQTPLLEIHDLRPEAWPRGHTHGVSFVLESGACVWITGPSGSGKTTLLRCVARLTPAAHGEAAIQGVSWVQVSATEWRTRVVYLHQKPVMLPGSVLSNLAKPFSLRSHQSRAFERPVGEALLRRLLLSDDVADKDALTLSVGEGARVALVRALLIEPSVLLLDETFAALDPASRTATVSLLKEWLNSGDRRIIGISHDNAVRDALGGASVPIPGTTEANSKSHSKK